MKDFIVFKNENENFRFQLKGKMPSIINEV